MLHIFLIIVAIGYAIYFPIMTMWAIMIAWSIWSGMWVITVPAMILTLVINQPAAVHAPKKRKVVVTDEREFVQWNATKVNWIIGGIFVGVFGLMWIGRWIV